MMGLVSRVNYGRDSFRVTVQDVFMFVVRSLRTPYRSSGCLDFDRTSPSCFNLLSVKD